MKNKQQSEKNDRGAISGKQEETTAAMEQTMVFRLFKNNIPPGISAEQEMKGFLVVLALAVGISFLFFLRLWSAYDALFEWTEEECVLRDGAVMADFSVLLGLGTFSGFLLVVWVPPVTAICHYRYYYQDSKSIYLMRRLPNRFELHKRALVLPFLELLLVVITVFLLVVLYYNIYLLVTPAQCLAPEQWQKLWR